ncbi:MAG: hypothetical protein JO092_03900 [Candidatus Eremiobacteraeota bacterium]|nr:hypothetical protein [Candidatus Eremiobacteraeota bacterium]
MRQAFDVDWVAVTAIGTIVSALVVVVGGTVAVYQLREGRRAAQFDATQRMIDRTLDLEFNRALRFVINDLPSRLTDPHYANASSRCCGSSRGRATFGSTSEDSFTCGYRNPRARLEFGRGPAD